MNFPQDCDGTSGVSALSSAFFYMFDINLAAKILSEKEQFKKSLREPAKTKKQESVITEVHYIVDIIERIERLLRSKESANDSMERHICKT